ncbi:TIGR00730 family Rossman fold protein [Alicyclobacillus sp. SO9]|uniref:LOG family protein n=1 Tax=Alicyclobacillus sp. SO9 TaxID=2665646 RepID=UPI0018E85D10|nr:TIGR00730 family Rossman fold protein [Alicyclobacillus sp. SO9]QQE78102.1 TIGR00730 family Rossman fold protein [Alicyclobacillus sp. SO9]
MEHVCVFAGSSRGNSREFADAARTLGQVIAKSNIGVVYGGSKTGLMGEVANAVLEQGGEVTGVMPIGLFDGEIVHTNLTRLIEVHDMHERKAMMGNLSDAYVALPGGYGTFEELFEVISWGQLGIHNKPIGILNVADYFTPFLKMIQHAEVSGFVHSSHRDLIVSDSNPESLLQKLEAYERPQFARKWDAK